MTDDRIWLDPPTDNRSVPRRRIDVRPGRWFTTLTLDRDDYVWRARKDRRDADADLRPGFEDALARYMNAACTYLWADGYPGTFLTSLGPETVTIVAPFAMADEAAQALKSAEMDGDMTKLEAVAAKLVIPLDQWLAPGERELRRGVDFTAPPTAFLRFLRAEASKRGLRLNGRAMPHAVWVRPQMPALARELQTQFPEQYAAYADPVRYADYEQNDNEPVRPYVGGRTAQRPSVVTPVVFQESRIGLDQGRKCPCGMHDPWAQHNGSRHIEVHTQWSTGVAIPRSLTWIGGNIAVVTATSPLAWRKLAFQCALVPKRENGYDFASFDVGDGEPSDENLRAYLYRVGGRVIGFVSVLDSSSQWWHEFDSEDEPELTANTIRPVVNVIFTAQIWRRHGIAKELVEAIAKDSNITLTDVAWSGPFSESGYALAKRINPHGVWMN